VFCDRRALRSAKYEELRSRYGEYITTVFVETFRTKLKLLRGMPRALGKKLNLIVKYSLVFFQKKLQINSEHVICRSNIREEYWRSVEYVGRLPSSFSSNGDTPIQGDTFVIYIYIQLQPWSLVILMNAGVAGLRKLMREECC
jgi:hypothetical protein